MTKISMKALLGAGSLAVIAAISLPPAAQAQGQPGTVNAAAPPQPGAMSPAGQPGVMAPAPQQNAYVTPQAGASEPSQFHQSNPRYPGPKLN